jgi:UDP-glucose 4-epimerase
VFHLAGQVSHVDGAIDPFPDVDINIRGTLVVLEAMRKEGAHGQFVYLGTRGQYSADQPIPVPEEAPTDPGGLYGISRLAAESCARLYHEVHGIPSVSLRLVNTYGPRHQMKHDRYGVLNWFVRKVLDGDPIPIFGDGSIIRDFLYVDDAVDSLIRVAESDRSWGQIYNVGHGTGTTFLDLAKAIIAVAGEGEIEFRPFTPERLAMEPGDYVADIRKIKEEIGWTPLTPLEEGLARTIEFYRRHRSKYWS